MSGERDLMAKPEFGGFYGAEIDAGKDVVYFAADQFTVKFVGSVHIFDLKVF